MRGVMARFDYHQMYRVIIISLLCVAKHTNSIQEVTVDMKHCAAYEVTTLVKEKVVMKTNAAYEHVQVKSNLV